MCLQLTSLACLILSANVLKIPKNSWSLNVVTSSKKYSATSFDNSWIFFKPSWSSSTSSLAPWNSQMITSYNPKAKQVYGLFARHTNLNMGVGGRKLFFIMFTVLTNGFGNGGWKIYQVGGPQWYRTQHVRTGV